MITMFSDISTPCTPGPGPSAGLSSTSDSAQHRRLLWWAIIRRPLAALAALCVTAVLLTGCSTLRVGYDAGPFLAHWWLDSRLALSAEQSEQVKIALARWLAWHRQTQLEPYAVLLAAARSEGAAAVTPAQMCRWAERLRDQAAPALEQILPAVAAIAPTLKPSQIDRLERRLEEDLERLRKQALLGTPEERMTAAIERSVERFEDFYGRLSSEQRQLVAEHTRRSPFEVERWLAERQGRHREVVQALRRATTRDMAVTLPEWRDLGQRLLAPPQADGGAYAQRLAAHRCELAARVHNAATPAQRQAAQRKLRGWEQDAREGARAAPAAAQTAAR